MESFRTLFLWFETAVNLRIAGAGKDAEKYAQEMSKIVEGLRGDAFTIDL